MKKYRLIKKEIFDAKGNLKLFSYGIQKRFFLLFWKNIKIHEISSNHSGKTGYLGIYYPIYEKEPNIELYREYMSKLRYSPKYYKGNKIFVGLLDHYKIVYFLSENLKNILFFSGLEELKDYIDSQEKVKKITVIE